MKVKIKCGGFTPQNTAEPFSFRMPLALTLDLPLCLIQNFQFTKGTINGVRNWSFALLLMFAWLSQAEAITLVNGGIISAAISTVGEQDSYTFTANTGENVQAQVADISNTDFQPQITLFDPNGVVVPSAAGIGDKVAILGNNLARYTATASGLYTVVVSNGFFGGQQNRVGSYSIYFVHMPGANEGGTLGNGSHRTESIDLGDLDSFTFSVSSSASIQIITTNTSGTDFVPRTFLFGPSGELINYPNQAVPVNLNVSGNYTVVVFDGFFGGQQNQIGTYSLTLTGSNITSADNPGVSENSSKVVPIPTWALAILGLGLLVVGFLMSVRKGEI